MVVYCNSDYTDLPDYLPSHLLHRPRIVKHDDFRRVGYAY